MMFSNWILITSGAAMLVSIFAGYANDRAMDDVAFTGAFGLAALSIGLFRVKTRA